MRSKTGLLGTAYETQGVVLYMSAFWAWHCPYISKWGARGKKCFSDRMSTSVQLAILPEDVASPLKWWKIWHKLLNLPLCLLPFFKTTPSALSIFLHQLTKVMKWRCGTSHFSIGPTSTSLDGYFNRHLGCLQECRSIFLFMKGLADGCLHTSQAPQVQGLPALC